MLKPAKNRQSIRDCTGRNAVNAPYTPKETAFELHYGRELNTKISNLISLDTLKKLTKTCISAKPDTLQVYSLNGDGAGGVSDQLPMKPKKGAKGVSNYPFYFYEKSNKT